MEAAPADQGLAPWGCIGTLIGTGTAIGDGAANTAAILGNACSTPGIAAELASNYIGCSGWFLPSKDELNKLYLQRAVVGGFSNYYYWSSSENIIFVSWIQHFPNGNQVSGVKSDSLRGRAVRGF